MKRKPYRFLLYLFLRTIALLIYPIPLRISTKLCAFIGRIAFYAIPKEREKTLKHLRIASGREKSEKEIRGIALRLFANLGRNAAEWVNFPKEDGAWLDKNITAEGLEHLDRARKKGKGIILMPSPFGHWELTSSYLPHKGYAGVIIARKIYIDQINDFFVKLRLKWGNEIMYRDESPKRALAALKKNSIIGILADQDVSNVEGIFVDFFGKPAYTPVAPVKFAIKTGAALIPLFFIRENGKIRLIVEKEIDIDTTGDKERDILVNTIRWMRVLEKYIRRYPDHWVWMHRRWKTKPKSVTSQEMQLIDKIAQERYHIPGITLMENAGAASACLAMNILNAKETGKTKRVAVFCGKGNNGGDGFVVARKLIEAGCKVTTYIFCDELELKRDPSRNMDLLKKMNETLVIVKTEGDISHIKDLDRYNLIIDAIFGTGFKGRPDDFITRIIGLINGSGVDILSIDVPSGLDATTGRCEGACVKATDTITFGIAKSGFFTEDGPEYTGSITVDNIGFPKELLNDPPKSPHKSP